MDSIQKITRMLCTIVLAQQHKPYTVHMLKGGKLQKGTL